MPTRDPRNRPWLGRLGRALPIALPLAAWAGGCGGNGGDPSDEGPTLTPEPPGSPTDPVQGRFECLGKNTPPPPTGSSLTLPGWVRSFDDPTNGSGKQPAARVEAFDETGASLGTAFSDGGSGRVAILVPVRAAGFLGTIVVSAPGFLDVRFSSSRATTGTAVAGWVWLLTRERVDRLGSEIGTAADPAKGIVVGAVHDCDSFGAGNALVRVASSTAGVTYFADFTAAAGRTFTAESGRFALPNLEPGPVTVEAYARTDRAGPLRLLGRADVKAVAGTVTAVDIQPRAGKDR